MLKKLFLVMFAFLFVSLAADAKKNEPVEYNYELAIDTKYRGATQGARIFKVWSYCKKKELLTQEVCMRNAVHGIIFKGLVGTDAAGGSYPALCPEGYDAHKEYFDNFFNSGAFKQYIQLTNKGMQDEGDFIHTAKKEWKVGLLVQVNVAALKKRLEADKIIQGARGIFTR